MSDLFEIEPTLSPRLEWMKKYGIEVCEITPPPGDRPSFPKFLAKHTIIEAAQTEVDAIVSLAKRMGIRLWNEI